MEGKGTLGTREKVANWIEEGRYLLSLIPGLPQENEQLKAAAEAAGKERERLRQEIEELRAENEHFRNEREELGSVFSKFMNETLQLMNELVEKLRATQRSHPAEQATGAAASADHRSGVR